MEEYSKLLGTFKGTWEGRSGHEFELGRNYRGDLTLSVYPGMFNEEGEWETWGLDSAIKYLDKVGRGKVVRLILSER